MASSSGADITPTKARAKTNDLFPYLRFKKFYRNDGTAYKTQSKRKTVGRHAIRSLADVQPDFTVT
jgi:hypothetical protein